MHELSFLNWKGYWLFSPSARPAGSDLSSIPSHSSHQCPQTMSALSMSNNILMGCHPAHLVFPAFILRTRTHLALCLFHCWGLSEPSPTFTEPQRQQCYSLTQPSPSLAVSPDLHLLGAPPHCPTGGSCFTFAGGPACGFPVLLPLWLPAQCPFLLPLVTAFSFPLGSSSPSSQPLGLKRRWVSPKLQG